MNFPEQTLPEAPTAENRRIGILRRHINPLVLTKSILVIAILFIVILLLSLLSQEIFTNSSKTIINDDGLDIILLIDLSYSSNPQDRDILSPYRIRVIEEIIKNLRDHHDRGDKIGVMVFADNVCQVLPANEFFTPFGYGQATSQNIIDIVKKCGNGQHPCMRQLDRNKTDITATLKSIYSKNTNEAVQPNKPRLAFIVSDGINDPDPFNRVVNVYDSLYDKQNIKFCISHLQEGANTQITMFQLPVEAQSPDSLRYCLTQQWKELLGSKYLLAPTSTKGMPEFITRAFTDFRLFNSKKIEVGISTPFMFTDDSLDGEIVFKVPELAAKRYYEITIDVDSIIWESTRPPQKNFLNLIAAEKELLKKQNIKLHSGNECPVKFSIALPQLSEIQSDSLAYIMFKVRVEQEAMDFVSGDTSKIKTWRKATGPNIAMLKVKLQKEVNIWTWTKPIFFIGILIAFMCLLCKVLPYLRFHYGLLNALGTIQISTTDPNLDFVEADVKELKKGKIGVERNFNGKIRIRFKDKKEELYQGHLYFRPFGSKNLDGLLIHTNLKTVIVVENEIRYGEYPQTFLEINGKEKTCHEENLLPEDRAIIISEEEFEKKDAVRLVIHPQVMNQQGRDKRYYRISINVPENPSTVRSVGKKILRKISSYLNFENRDSRCKIEKFGKILSLSLVILSGVAGVYSFAQFKHIWIKLIPLIILVVIISLTPVSKIRSRFQLLVSGKIFQVIFEWFQRKLFG